MRLRTSPAKRGRRATAHAPFVDADTLALAGRDLRGGLAAEGCDFAVEVPDAGFAGVLADQVAERIVGELDLLVRQPVRFDLLGDEVALGDPQLLVLGVTRQTDDLHAVEERRRDGLEALAVQMKSTRERSKGRSR